MEGYKWKKIIPTNENDPDEAPRKKDDHTTDAIRYIIMSRPDIQTGGAVNKFEIKQKTKQLDPHAQLLNNAIKNNPKDFIKLK